MLERWTLVNRIYNTNITNLVIKLYLIFSISSTSITTTSKSSICTQNCKEIVEESVTSTCRKRICSKLDDQCLRNSLCDGLICECKEPLVFNGTECINIKECPCVDKITRREFRVNYLLFI